MRIAVDAMGGDFAPREIVDGAVRAAASLPSVGQIFLVGDQAAIERELRRSPAVSPKISIRHASEVVAMDESPAQAVRRKRDSSIGRAVDMVKQGEADAVVSAGNTGGIVVAATLKLRTLPGVERPALATVFPTRGRPCILLDAGANVECKPSMLAQFAVMGTVYSRIILGQARPVVGLLSIGGEEGKGTEVTKEAFRLIEKSHLNFRGNVEGHDLFEGETDVTVCDGFVGNAVLKTAESLAKMMIFWMRTEFKRSMLRRCGALLLAGGFKTLKSRLDPDAYGGAPLLGVNGVCIKTHGSSKANAVYHAIRAASESVHHHLNQAIVEEVARLGASA
jgi:glycerol-3-phosphate acyltransferase PlsX